METEARVFVPDHHTVRFFCTLLPDALRALGNELQLSLTVDGLLFAQSYYRDTLHRDPTVGELRFLDRYATQAALSVEAMTVTELHFEARDDLRVWKDLCKKQAELNPKNAISPQTVSEMLQICGRYLERCGRTSAYPALRLATPAAVAAETAATPPTSDGLVATLNERPNTAPAVGSAILLLKPHAAATFGEEIATLLQQLPDALSPLCAVGEEGLLSHLTALGMGMELDAAALPVTAEETIYTTLENATRSSLLLLASPVGLPALLSSNPSLILLGRVIAGDQVILRRGIAPIGAFSLDFLSRWHQKRRTALSVPALSAHTATAPCLRAENDLLLGTVTVTGRALPGIVALIRSMLMAGAGLEACGVTATLTLPGTAAEALADAMPLVLDYHRALAELALPGKNECVTCANVAAPALTVAIAAPKAAQNAAFSPEALDLAIENADFAAFRQVLYENL